MPVVICAKGIERDTGKPLSRVVAEELPEAVVATLSGPTFAAELARGLPAAATLACRDDAMAAVLAQRLSNAAFRLYHTTDVTGVELAGALKNVLAIACGIVAGSGMGENARAAIMTRGIAEIGRLSAALGARPETLMGLAGFGDIALTCSSPQSRNFAFGLRIAEGAHTPDKLAEGAATSGAVLTMAGAQGIEMPVAETVHAIIEGNLSIEAAMAALMQRPLKREE
jgi:glycerol-3-phosphate dehydrogenase (NAD(P)+)